jgi:glycosyltransferase involved in cell wall biosynthesis
LNSNSPLPAVRALHLLPHQGVGGVQRFVIELVRHERMDQAADELVLTDRPLNVETDFLAPATPVHFLGLVEEKLKRRAERLADLAESRSARTLVVYQARDLALALAAKAHASHDLRIVTHLFDGPEGFSPSSGGLLRAFRPREELRSVDRFFVASPALVAPWNAAGAEAEVRLAAIDIQRFHPQQVQSSWRAARLPDPETLLIGSLMRAEAEKGQDVLIAAVNRRHAAGRPTALMLVGDGSLHPALREQAKASETLFVRRRVLDAPGFFGRIDAFALHSPSELVPMGLLESLACGRAATVADPGGVAALVGMEGALFTPPGDVDAVIEAFDRLDEPGFRQSLGEAGRQRAVEHHNLGQLRSALAPDFA